MAARRRIGEGEEDRLPDRVRSIVLSRLGGARPTESEVARVLRMSSRTLQRKLREQGTSYRSTLAATLCLCAVRELAAPGRSVAEVAARLGFSDPANFSRAFRRWTGASPLAFRRSAIRSDPGGSSKARDGDTGPAASRETVRKPIRQVRR